MTKTFTPEQHKTAAQFIKVQGILSIVLGGLGIIFFPVLITFAIIILNDPSLLSQAEITQDDLISAVFRLILLFPASIYFVIAGIILLRNPSPKVAKGLTIANVVVAAFSNIVILAFAIVSVVQSEAYKHGYKATKSN